MPRLRKSYDPSSCDFAREGRPFTPDELLLKDNIPAFGPFPASLVEQMSERIVHVSSWSDEAEPMAAIDWQDGTSAFRLSESAFLGRLGGSGERAEVAHSRGATADTAPFQPEWGGYVYHPKLTVGERMPDLRRADGRRVRPHAVYDPDNRAFFFPTGYPMHCVGRILVWDDPSASMPQRSGSAVLVGRRVLLTASHLMPRDGRPGRWGVRFVPGYFDGSSSVGLASWCEAYRVAAVMSGPDDALQAFDVAVMKLYDPLGDPLGWFGTTTYSTDWEDQAMWTLVGYPGAAAGVVSNGERPTIQNGISVIDDDPDGSFAEIEHRGDASPGNSGGPLFGTFPDGPYAIGVHSGDEYRTIDIPLVPTIAAENNNVAAGGAGMVNMVRAAQTDWP
jgi:V8-like Glu-specific endopeptidase